jgi:hypothetical protein
VAALSSISASASSSATAAGSAPTSMSSGSGTATSAVPAATSSKATGSRMHGRVDLVVWAGVSGLGFAAAFL